MTLEKNKAIRETVAESLCKALGYDKHILAEIRDDSELGNSYVRVLDPKAPEISFIRTECKSREVLFVKCMNLECGVQSVYSGSGATVLPKISSSGDWPWHVALYRSDIHVCDGTLVAENWVLTTEGCFQGQSKAIWMAVLGLNRLNASPPWLQRRRIVSIIAILSIYIIQISIKILLIYIYLYIVVIILYPQIGMIKSPVEGSTAALIRLEQSVEFSDFVRPICLSDEMNQRVRHAIPTVAQPLPNIPYSKSHSNIPHAEKLETEDTSIKIISNPWPEKSLRSYREHQHYFESPYLDYGLDHNPSAEKQYHAGFIDKTESIPKAEALKENLKYPLPSNSPQTAMFKNSPYHPQPSMAVMHFANLAAQEIANERQTQWAHCNTLGWTRTRNQLQRVQLKLGDMAACENVSIATVNSMCAEAVYHKQDCSVSIATGVCLSE